MKNIDNDVESIILHKKINSSIIEIYDYYAAYERGEMPSLVKKNLELIRKLTQLPYEIDSISDCPCCSGCIRMDSIPGATYRPSVFIIWCEGGSEECPLNVNPIMGKSAEYAFKKLDLLLSDEEDK